MPSDRLFYDSNGNVIHPADLKARVKQDYDQWENAPMFDTTEKPMALPPPTNEAPSYDQKQIEQHNALGNALMKQAAEKEQLEMQRRAEEDKARQMGALNNYNRILGNPYTENQPKPGAVSDEQAAALASEFTKQPPRFKNLKKMMGSK